MLLDLEYDQPKNRGEQDAYTRRLILFERSLPPFDPDSRLSRSCQVLRERCFELLIHTHEGMLTTLLKPYLPSTSVPDRRYLELRTAALLGLQKVFRKFDLDRGVLFITYAWPTVDGEIKRYLRDETKSRTTLTRGDIELAMNIEKYEMDGYDDEAIAELLEISVDAIKEARHKITTKMTNQSYEELVEQRGDSFSGEPSVDLATLEFSELTYTILGIVNGLVLTARDEGILWELFGIHRNNEGIFTLASPDEWSPATQASTGIKLGYSQMHINRLKERLLDQIREALSATDSSPV